MNTVTSRSRSVLCVIESMLRLTAWQVLSFVTDALLRVESMLISQINDIRIVIEKSHQEIADTSELTWPLEPTSEKTNKSST